MNTLMASSSSSPPSLPVLSSRSWYYDVFLSFRGADTRKTFVDHLYKALDQSGIYTYKDDITLPRGESISPALLTAIEESQIAVVIFSKNYANSTWCLDELTHIMECRDNKKQIVLPIFYEVEPWEVRKQEGEYKKSFENHELKNTEKVVSWRKALVGASNISGWEIKQIANGHEAQVIKQIVRDISLSLKPVTSGENGKLIGMRERVEGLISELQIKSGGVRMVGIWGVGGGGKTTLANSIYDKISSLFDGSCFVDNVRVESSNDGLKKLQGKILKGVLKQKEVDEVTRVDQGRQMIKARLHHKKVLIVLDDVDHLHQLKALVGSHDWFGEGSRIIITTRDEHVLKAHRVDVICPISLLYHDEAWKLFCKCAHRDHTPMEDEFEKLSEEVVKYAGGLPLALTVLGAFLCDKNVGQWRSALDRLKEIPHKDIIGILRISFDGLEEVEKNLFLDIACIFRREKKYKAMELFEACGFHPVIGVEVLRQKALIVIDRWGEFDMHDLVQEMAHHIVRGEHPNNPEKHSRVCKREDVSRVLATAAMMKLDNIEAIDQAHLSFEEAQRFLQVAGNMNKLRWIQLGNNEEIDWSSDEESDEERDEKIVPLPENFPPPQLCYLYLEHCFTQIQLWEDHKDLHNLKHMELVTCPNLINIPDFSGLPRLETFKLEKCPCLEEIHPSIGRLESLVFLSIQICDCLRKIPDFSGLLNLEKFEIEECPCLEEIHPSIGRLERLVFLSVKDCDSLRKIPDFSGLLNLETFILDCPYLAEIHPSIGRLERLVFISVTVCESLRKFPSITRIKKLETLVFRYDKNAIISESQQDMYNSGKEVASCSSPPPGVESCLPHNNINHRQLQFSHSSLRELALMECSLGDEEIGSDVWDLPNLEELNLSWNHFSRLDFSILRLPRLKWLDVSFCSSLVELSELPSSISVVEADGCWSLESFGDISNCKWLWNVSLLGKNKLGQLRVDTLIHSMLQENASKDHYISVLLGQHKLPNRFIGRVFKRNAFKLHLPDDWYNDFSGFLICVVTERYIPEIKIKIGQEEPPFDLSQESDEAMEPIYRIWSRTCIGYVPFSSLRHTTLSTLSYDIISLTIKYPDYIMDESAYVGTELITRKIKSDEVQTTNCSEFWDGKSDTFRIQQCDSKSSVEISWSPLADLIDFLNWPLYQLPLSGIQINLMRDRLQLPSKVVSTMLGLVVVPWYCFLIKEKETKEEYVIVSCVEETTGYKDFLRMNDFSKETILKILFRTQEVKALLKSGKRT